MRVTRTNHGGDPEVQALPLEYLPGWLFTISVARVRPELQEKILRYRRECFRVLWRAFHSDALAAPEPRYSTPESAGGLVHIRAMGLVIAQLAEQQMRLETRADGQDQRLGRAALVIREVERRLGQVEQQLQPGEVISEQQATTVSLRVKALGELLGRTTPGKNYYQAIFAELYRRFHVLSHKLIQQSEFEAVVQFRDDWQALVISDQ